MSEKIGSEMSETPDTGSVTPVTILKTEPPKSPFFNWWCEMLDINPDIDSRWSARDVADAAFAAGYNHAVHQWKRRKRE